MASAKIAIIGGGPGGLTLACLLKLQKIPFRLFELDESPTSRSQGGTLDIHKDSGQMALKAAGLFTEFEKHARREGAALKILDKDGKVVFADDGLNPEGSDVMPPDQPEIDRRDLRKIFLNSLGEGVVEWGKKVVNILEDESSTKEKPQFTVEFEGGAKESGFELIVGADGAWSRVRGLLTKEKPFYSGVTFIEARVDDVDAKHPDLAERVGLGSCWQLNGISALFSQRNTDGTVRTYASIRVEEDWVTTCGIDWTNAPASKHTFIEKNYAGWDDLGKGFVLRSDEPLIVRPMYMLPVEMKWETRPGVTLLGDAAHLMTPAAGVGVNLALTDALDLSEAIRSHLQDQLDWATALRDFEGKMLARSHIEAKKTFTNLTNAFSGVDVNEIVKRIGEAMLRPFIGGPAGLILTRLLKLQNIPFRLFELDKSSESRSQGDSLDLHKDAGQKAMKAADKDGTVVWTDDGLNPEGSDVLPPDQPAIDRRDLRKILLNSLDEGMGEWGKKVVKDLEDEDSTKKKPQYTIELEGGAKESGFELVVGADGAWSRVRGLLTKQKPFYSGITGVEAHVENVNAEHPDLAERIGLGWCIQMYGHSVMMNQRNTDGSVKTLASAQVNKDWVTTCGIDWTDVQGSKQALVDTNYSGWESLCKEFILRSDGPLTLRPMYMLPVEMKWETCSGATVIGDAAHLMTPFAGVGVNLALTDALDLAQAIRSHVEDKVDWTTALRRFETKILARSHIEAKRTFTNLTNLFSGESVQDIIGRVGQTMVGAKGMGDLGRSDQ
ncbi:hypothetical protein D9756_008291 [Leucocoprinus leucothites]|uniref:FAD-binding domain-containing protein n=1 Tax=Leucocoprinus leucothites TaxID=201217 RepID=A0A8H5CZT2_9AGAR|nr:hypothetical protein D9756_008291 [Leucoagaricus leucothites]